MPMAKHWLIGESFLLRPLPRLRDLWNEQIHWGANNVNQKRTNPWNKFHNYQEQA